MQQMLDTNPTEILLVAGLQSAVMATHPQCVRLLLLRPLSEIINSEAFSFCPLLCLAMHPAKPRESAEIVKILLDNGISPHCTYPFNEGRTYYLNAAVKMNLIEVIKLLLQHGAETEDMRNVFRAMYSLVVFHQYITPLHEAFNELNINACKLIFLYGGVMNLHKIETSRNTPPNGVVSLLHILVDKVSFLSARQLKNEMGKYLEALTLFQQFGGDVHLNFHGTSALEYLQTRWPQDKDWGGFDVQLERISTTPMSLLDLSRLAVRNAIGRECLQAIPRLPLPKDLKALMTFYLDN